MSVLTLETVSKSRPRLVRQWLSGVASVLLVTSVVLPLLSGPTVRSESPWWTVRVPALVLGLIMLALFVSQSRRTWAVGLTIAAVLIPLLPRLGGDTRDYWWMFSRGPLVVLGLIVLALIVWNRRRHWAVGLASAVVLLSAVLFTFWLFWNATTPLSGAFPLSTAGAGYYVYLAGLGVTAIAAIAHAFPERRHD